MHLKSSSYHHIFYSHFHTSSHSLFITCMLFFNQEKIKLEVIMVGSNKLSDYIKCLFLFLFGLIQTVPNLLSYHCSIYFHVLVMRLNSYPLCLVYNVKFIRCSSQGMLVKLWSCSRLRACGRARGHVESPQQKMVWKD